SGHRAGGGEAGSGPLGCSLKDTPASKRYGPEGTSLRPFSRPFSDLAPRLLSQPRSACCRAVPPLLTNTECQPFGAAGGSVDSRLLTAPIAGALQAPFRCPWRLPPPLPGKRRLACPWFPP